MTDLIDQARWDTEGQPANIQAAAADACEWLVRMNPQTKTERDRLDRCMARLVEHAKSGVDTS